MPARGRRRGAKRGGAATTRSSMEVESESEGIIDLDESSTNPITIDEDDLDTNTAEITDEEEKSDETIKKNAATYNTAEAIEIVLDTDCKATADETRVEEKTPTANKTEDGVEKETGLVTIEVKKEMAELNKEDCAAKPDLKVEAGDKNMVAVAVMEDVTIPVTAVTNQKPHSDNADRITSSVISPVEIAVVKDKDEPRQKEDTAQADTGKAGNDSGKEVSKDDQTELPMEEGNKDEKDEAEMETCEDDAKPKEQKQEAKKQEDNAVKDNTAGVKKGNPSSLTGTGVEEAPPLPTSFTKLKQLTVNIGPLRQLDLMSKALHDVLHLSDEFNINFELKEKKDNGTTKKEKCGFVRIPFKLRSPKVLVQIADRLGSLRIDGRDMSVKFPEVFQNALKDCKEYLKGVDQYLLAKKKKRFELQQKRLLIANPPEGVDVAMVKALFPDASSVIINTKPGKDDKPVPKSVFLEFPDKETCLKSYRANKTVKILDQTLQVSTLVKDQTKSPKRKPFAMRGRGSNNGILGANPSSTRGRGFGQATTFGRGTNFRGVNRGSQGTLRGSGRGIRSLTQGTLNRALHDKPSVTTQSAGNGNHASRRRNKSNQWTQSRNQGQVSPRQNRTDPFISPKSASLSLNSYARNRQNVSSSMGFGTRNQQDVSPGQGFGARNLSDLSPGRGYGVKQSPGRYQANVAAADEDPLALMQYLRSKLEKMEQTIGSGSRASDQSFPRQESRNQGRSYDDHRQTDAYDRGYKDESSQRNQGSWDDRSYNRLDSYRQQGGGRGQAQSLGAEQKKKNRKRKSTSYGPSDAKKQYSTSDQMSNYSSGYNLMNVSEQHAAYRNQQEWMRTNTPSTSSMRAASQPQTMWGTGATSASQQGMSGLNSTVGYDYQSYLGDQKYPSNQGYVGGYGQGGASGWN